MPIYQICSLIKEILIDRSHYLDNNLFRWLIRDDVISWFIWRYASPSSNTFSFLAKLIIISSLPLVAAHRFSIYEMFVLSNNSPINIYTLLDVDRYVASFDYISSCLILVYMKFRISHLYINLTRYSNYDINNTFSYIVCKIDCCLLFVFDFRTIVVSLWIPFFYLSFWLRMPT